METFFLECTPGLEKALLAEVESLGFKGSIEKNGIKCQAPFEAMETLNRKLRLATEVKLQLGNIVSVSGLPSLHLERFADEFEVAAPKAFLAHLKHRTAAAQLSIFPEGKGLRVTLNTTGAPLYQRGYRQEIGRAPLRETLAAGILKYANWKTNEPMWDIMCGSGTIVIEAAEMALGLEAGRNRTFQFEEFKCFQKKENPNTATQIPSTVQLTHIRGSDLNAGALGTARRNAKRAGVLESISLERTDALKLVRPATSPGLLVANLPYGKRVNSGDDLFQLYSQLSKKLAQDFKGYRFAFLLEDGAQCFKLKIEQTVSLSNGGIRCQLLIGTV
jgi:putative N6-adenine-specific DNA methylase